MKDKNIKKGLDNIDVEDKGCDDIRDEDSFLDAYEAFVKYLVSEKGNN